MEVEAFVEVNIHLPGTAIHVPNTNNNGIIPLHGIRVWKRRGQRRCPNNHDHRSNNSLPVVIIIPTITPKIIEDAIRTILLLTKAASLLRKQL